MKALIEAQNPAGFRMIADSAFGRNGQPWFVPDFGTDWQWRPMLAFRVSRLGKCVARKFASRYYDAMTLMFVPMCESPEADVLLGCMDGGAVAGSWIPLAEAIDIDGLNHLFSEFAIDDFLARASRHTTLKTGDILALEIPGISPEPATLNRRVEMKLNGETVLGFNIK